MNGLFELIEFIEVSEKSHLIKRNRSKSASKLDLSRNSSRSRWERATKQLRFNPKNRSISLLHKTPLTNLSDQQQAGQRRRGAARRNHQNHPSRPAPEHDSAHYTTADKVHPLHKLFNFTISCDSVSTSPPSRPSRLFVGLERWQSVFGSNETGAESVNKRANNSHSR